MSDRIEQYLAELDRRLDGAVSAELRKARVQEVRGHLYLAQRDLMADGLREDEAALEAVRKLGSAQNVADDLSRQALGYDHKSVWRLARVPCIIVVAITVISIAFSFASVGDAVAFWYRFYRLWSVLVYVSLAWAAWKSRRWLVRPVVITMTAVVIIPYAIYTIRVSLNPRDYVRGSTASETQAMRDAYDHDFFFPDKISHAKATYNRILGGGHAESNFPGFFAVPDHEMIGMTAWAPGTIIPATYMRDSGLQEMDMPGLTQDQADQKWRELGPALIDSLESQYAHIRVVHDGFPLVASNALQQLSIDAGLSVVAVAYNGILLWAVNGLVLAFAKAKRRRVNDRDPLLA